MRPTLLLLAAVACGTPTPKEPPVRARPTHLEALAWRCTDLDVVFYPTDSSHGRLKILEEVREVTLRPTAKGFEYGDDQVAFRMAGDAATITLADVSIAEEACPDDEVSGWIHDHMVQVLADGAVEHEIDANQLRLTRGDIGLLLTTE